MSIRGSRFRDAPWNRNHRYGSNSMCIIGGAGGIGSWLTLLLVRAGFFPIIYDFDIVEEHNMGGQLFLNSSIGESKVDAIKKVVENLTDYTKMETHEEAYTQDTMTHRYIFSAFDNMKARRDMFEKWKSFYKDDADAIFIDGRLLMEQLQIFCVTKDNADYYEENYLFSDAEVEDESCSAKQTSHSAAMIASLMVGFFTNHITNVLARKTVRRVPFSYEYFIPINLTTTYETVAELST